METNKLNKIIKYIQKNPILGLLTIVVCVFIYLAISDFVIDMLVLIIKSIIGK